MTSPGWRRGVRIHQDPSPYEIELMCRQIRSTWDTYEMLIRSGRLSREDADRLRAADRMRHKRKRGVK